MIDGEETSTMEEWEEYGDQVKTVQKELRVLRDMISYEVPADVHRSELIAMQAKLDDLKIKMEDRLIQEHPQEWHTRVFYGGDTDK